MPNAAQMLREDHRRIQRMFKQFEKLQDSAAKKALVDAVTVELTVHSMLEEEIFYPAVRRNGLDADLMDEAAEEHHVADVIMDELAKMSSTNDAFGAKFTVLMENVNHHIGEEESEMLPKAERIGAALMSELGTKMAARRDELIESNGQRTSAGPAERRSPGARASGKKTDRSRTVARSRK